MNNRNVEEEISKTLASFDGVQKVDAPPFLYTRIRAGISARMAKRKSPIMILLTKPALSFTILFVMATINFYLITQINHTHTRASNNKDLSIQNFAKEYGMVSYSFYDK